MTHRSWSFIAAASVFPLLVIVVITVGACAPDEKKVPAAPSGPATSGTIPRDAGSKANDDEDAGRIDGGSPITLCTRITGMSGGMDSAEIGTWVETPGDLELTRQVERWTNDCKNLRLILEVSDGLCPLGSGHAVTFSFGYQDVLDGVLHAGNNIVGAETETPAISVRYTRPKKLTSHGTWGTCEGASGQLVFLSQPVLEPGRYLQARYELDLTACEGGATANTMFLEGAFQVLLRTSRTEACPPSAGSGGAGGLGDGFGVAGDPFGAGGSGGTTGTSDF
jgi:hypothetical protein